MAPFASSLMVVLLCYIYSKIGISASFVFLFLPIAFFLRSRAFVYQVA